MHRNTILDHGKKGQGIETGVREEGPGGGSAGHRYGPERSPAIRLAAEFTPGLQFGSAKVKMDFTVTEEGSINFILTGKEALEGTHPITIEFER